MRLLQFLKHKKLQSKCRRLIRKNFSKDEIIRPKKRAFRKAYQADTERAGRSRKVWGGGDGAMRIDRNFLKDTAEDRLLDVYDFYLDHPRIFKAVAWPILIIIITGVSFAASLATHWIIYWITRC